MADKSLNDLEREFLAGKLSLTLNEAAVFTLDTLRRMYWELPEEPPVEPPPVVVIGGTNFAVLVNLGTKLSNLLDAKTVSTAGLLLKEFFTGLTLQQPALALTTVNSGSPTVLQNPAPRLTTVNSGTVTPTSIPAIALTTSNTGTALSVAIPAPRLTTVNSGTANANVLPAGRLTTVATNTQAGQQSPAANMVQIKYDLTGTYGAATATNTTVTGAAWTNPTNAQGVRNGTLSSHAGSVTSAQDAHLTFAYAAVTGKDALTITNVTARFYVSQTGTALNNGGLEILTSINAGGAYTQQILIAGNVDNLTTPLSYDLTANFPTFASLANFRGRVRHTTVLGATPTGNVDAVELVVTASVTDLL